MSSLLDKRIKTEHSILDRAIETIETLSGSHLNYTFLWKYQRIDDISPPLALQNQLIITNALWKMLREEEKIVLAEYVSFNNFLKMYTNHRILHLVDFAKGVLYTKWTYDGMLFVYKYMLQPVMLDIDLPFENPVKMQGYQGSFWIPARNMPLIIGLIASFLYRQQNFYVEQAILHRLSDLISEKKIFNVIERMPVGASVTVEIAIPEVITYHSFFSALHFIEIIQGKNWKRE